MLRGDCIKLLTEYIQARIKMDNSNMKDYFEWFLRNSRIYHTINREESKILSKF